MARSPRRIAAALLLSGATALGVGACSPITTMQPYNPSDGVRGVLGTQISTDNLMILTDAEGSQGLLLGGVTNKSGDEAQVSFAVDGASGALDVTVPSHSTLLLGPEHEEVIVPSVPAPPGAVVKMTVSTAQSGSITLSVPVLDGTLPAYDPYVPVTPSESSASPSAMSETDSNQGDTEDETTDQ